MSPSAFSLRSMMERIKQLPHLIRKEGLHLPRRILVSEYFIFYLCIFAFLVLWPIVPTIATEYNLINMLSNIWPLFAVTIGQTFVLIIAGIDLSQGAVISLASVVGMSFIATKVDPAVFSKSPIWGTMLFEDGAILSKSEWGILVAIIAMLAVGLLIGMINGLLIAYARIPAFMVTLTTSMFFAALAVFYTKSENIINVPDSFAAIGEDTSLISPSLVITLVLALIAQAILSFTVFGRWLYAIGTNIRAAVVSGVPTRKVIVMTYMFSGFCAGVASVLYTARADQGRPTMGAPFLLNIIGGAVIGGSSLAGGKGKVIWTLFGVVFLTMLDNALYLLNVPFFWIEIAKGSVILAAALIDITRTRILQRSVQS